VTYLDSNKSDGHSVAAFIAEVKNATKQLVDAAMRPNRDAQETTEGNIRPAGR
jgi:hypothetical protein